MKKPQSRTSKTTHKRQTEFKKMYEKRMRTECELRYVTNKLQRTHEWLPLLAIEQPRKKPAAVLKALRERQSELLGTIKELQQKGIGRRPWRKPPTDLPPRPGLPDKDTIRQIGIIVRYLDRIRETRRKKEPNTMPVWPIDTEEAQSLWLTEAVKDQLNTLYGGSALLQRCGELVTDRYVIQSHKLIKYPTVNDSGVNGRYFDTDFTLEPSTHECKMVYDGSFISPNETGTFGPIPSFLGELAALEFEIPRPRCDSYIHYQVPMKLIVSANAIAGLQYVNFWHYTSVVYCEQPDANAGAPQSVWDFRNLSPWLEVACTDESTLAPKIHSWDPFEGHFFVKKGVRSKVHIGLQPNTQVWGLMFAWDQLSLSRPYGEDIWGLKLTVIPA